MEFLSLPVIIMLCLIGVLVIALLIFLMSTKKIQKDSSLFEDVPDLKMEISSTKSNTVAKPRDTPPAPKLKKSEVETKEKPLVPDEFHSPSPVKKEEIEKVEEKSDQSNESPDFEDLPDYGDLFEPDESPEEPVQIQEDIAETLPDPIDEIFGSGDIDDELSEISLEEFNLAASKIQEPIPELNEKDDLAIDIFGSDDGSDIPTDQAIEDILDQVATKAKVPKAPVPPKPDPIPEKQMDPDEEKRHEKAKRISRVIVNDIRNYNPENWLKAFKREI